MTQELRGTVRLTVEVPETDYIRQWAGADGFVKYNEKLSITLDFVSPSGEVTPMEVPEHWRKK